MKLTTVVAQVIAAFRSIDPAAALTGPNTLEELFTARFARGDIDVNEYSRNLG